MKTNKLFLSCLVLFLMIGATASAQLRFGLRGEVGLNKPSFSEEAIKVENLNAFRIGPTAEFSIPLVGLAIEGSLLYENSKINVFDEASSKQKITNHYLDIPVNLKYKMGFILPVKAYLAAGPYGRFHLAGDDVKIGDFTKDIKAKNFEMGINLGVGAEVFSRLAVGINYGFILTDNYGTDNPQLKDALNAFNGKKGTWSLTASVYF